VALNKQDSAVLQEIVNLDGNCINSLRCAKCPFRAMCLPEFLNVIPPTTQQRAKMALDVLVHHSLVDEDLVAAEFKWDKI
jgi:hypothetical protein